MRAAGISILLYRLNLDFSIDKRIFLRYQHVLSQGNCCLWTDEVDAWFDNNSADGGYNSVGLIASILSFWLKRYPHC
jgi:hypothetical protein